MDAEDPTQGYLIGEGANYVETFMEGAMSLEKEGDYCLVESDYGFHIIKRLGDAEAGDVAYEDVQVEFDILAKANFQSEYYADLVDEWMADAGIVTIYDDVIAKIGQ